jgi:hypothetical protein
MPFALERSLRNNKTPPNCHSLQEKAGIPWHLQGLVFQGRQLQDELSLASYGIAAESTVHLVLSLRCVCCA